MIGYIYTLSDITNDYVFYVGSTCDLKERYQGHLTPSKKVSKQLYQYIKYNDIKFKLELVEAIDVPDRISLNKIESYWINQFKEWGFKLQNKTNFNNTNNAYYNKPTPILDEISKTYSNNNELIEDLIKIWQPCREFIKKNNIGDTIQFKYSSIENDFLLDVDFNLLNKKIDNRNITEKKLNILTFNDLVIDINRKEVIRNNVTINLTKKEFKVLLLLIINKDKVTSSEEIRNKIWDDSNVQSLPVYINFLRKKVDQPFNTNYIHTITGFGYCLK